MLRKWIALLLALCLMPFAALEGFAEPSEVDDYDRAFEQGYVDATWADRARDEQVTSTEYRALLKRMVETLAPEQTDYFDASVSEVDLPLTRELAIYMSWYAAVCVGADGYNNDFDYNRTAGDPQGETDEYVNDMVRLCPTLLDGREVVVGPFTWTMEGLAATFWNQLHSSPHSGLQTVAFDEGAGSMRYLDPFTVEDAVSAMTRLWDGSGRAEVTEGGISERDVARLVQDAYRAGTGKDSTFLAAVIADESDAYLENPATRFWFAILVGHSYNEWFSGDVCDGDWKAFIDAHVDPGQQMPLTIPSGIVGQYVDNEYNTDASLTGRYTCSEAIFMVCTDVGEWLSGGFNGAIPYHNSVNPFVPYLAATLYDRTTGEKVLPPYEDATWRPLETMTTEDAEAAALRYAHSYEAPAEIVAYEAAGEYDHSIITDDLLSKQTALPYNDCRNLPAEWHGVTLGKLSQLCDFALGVETDHTVYPFEIEIIRECGLNFVRLGVSFSRLQGQHDVGERNKVNLTRLRELDQVLAWCMENDVHCQIVASDLPNYFGEWDTGDFFAFIEEMGYGPQSDEEIAEFAAFWGMLADRYEEIPNEYLSFNVINEPWVESDAEYARMYGPAVEAIRASTPNRTIVADIHNPGELTGETMAEMGVALSAHFYEPLGFIRTEPWSDEDWTEEGVTSKKWPGEYRDIRWYFNGEETPWIASYNTVKATADAHDVGFIVNEFGILILDKNPGTYMPYRYSDEAMYGYYGDVIDAFEEDGTPWCLGIFNSDYGPVQLLPLHDTEYEKVGYYYLDTRFRDFLRRYAVGE